MIEGRSSARPAWLGGGAISLMGSDPGLDPLAFDNEHWLDTGGRATVELPTLYVGRYEVTVAAGTRCPTPAGP